MGTIVIESFVPYPNFHPGLFAVSHDTIDFAKELREIGFEVEFKPSNNGKIFFLKENADISPTVQWIFMTATSIVTGVAANLITDKLKQIISKYKQPHNIVVDLPEVSSVILPSGELIDKANLRLQKKSMVRPWVRRFQIEGLPSGYPIYFEHSARIVAWGEVLYEDKVGLKVENVILLDPEIEEMVKKKKEIGCSFGGIVKTAICSVCKSDYITCPHLRWRNYEGQSCYVEIREIALAEISLVMNPAQAQAKIQWKK